MMKIPNLPDLITLLLLSIYVEPSFIPSLGSTYLGNLVNNIIKCNRQHARYSAGVCGADLWGVTRREAHRAAFQNSNV